MGITLAEWLSHVVAGSIPSFQFKFSLHFDFGTLADLNGAVKIEFTRHDSQKVKCLSIECSAVVGNLSRSALTVP